MNNSLLMIIRECQRLAYKARLADDYNYPLEIYYDLNTNGFILEIPDLKKKKTIRITISEQDRMLSLDSLSDKLWKHFEALMAPDIAFINQDMS